MLDYKFSLSSLWILSPYTFGLCVLLELLWSYIPTNIEKRGHNFCLCFSFRELVPSLVFTSALPHGSYIRFHRGKILSIYFLSS
jgi:hypothetical protein